MWKYIDSDSDGDGDGGGDGGSDGDGVGDGDDYGDGLKLKTLLTELATVFCLLTKKVIRPKHCISN